MDIHRCRFVQYPPSAINTLAFSHPSSSKRLKSKPPSTLRLAVGRANGDIEIWNPCRGNWFQERVLRGGKDRSVEGLVWTQEPGDFDKNGYRLPGRLRLFSIGYSPTVTEWDIAEGKPARHSSGNYSDVWCFAAQPEQVSTEKKEVSNGNQTSHSQSLVIGCADGSLILLSTADNDLRFSRNLARPSKKGARVLDVTFQDTFRVISGHADSTIRVYDIRNGQQIRNVTLGAGPKGAPKETLIWSVRCLNDRSFVTGDSTGTVCFWDAKTYTLTQRVTAHEADVLALDVSADGNSVFSGGMDRRTFLYKRSTRVPEGRKVQWAPISHSRMHKHDIKSMATFESKDFSVLVTGGLDANPVVVPIQEFGNQSHRTLSSLPQQPPLLSAPSQRYVVSWWDRDIRIWSLPARDQQEVDQRGGALGKAPESRRLLAKILLKGDESIANVDITPDGRCLAAATIAGVKVFCLSPSEGYLKIQRIETPSSLGNHGTSLLKFSEDSKWLATVTGGEDVQVFKLCSFSDDGKLPYFLPQKTKLRRQPSRLKAAKLGHGSLENYERTVNNLAFSDDSRILAASDLSGHLDTWVLEGREETAQGQEDQPKVNGSHVVEDSSSSDSDEETSPPLVFGQCWVPNPSSSLLPRLPATPLVLAFRPSPPSIITEGVKPLSNGTYGPPLHPTRHNPHPHSKELPSGEDRLLVITAGNRLFELHVLSGQLSDWSRRNPSESFPTQFRNIRDPAKEVIWDVVGASDAARSSRERVWIYGISWLWMFDLSQDISASTNSIDNPNPFLKRKAQGQEMVKSNRKRKRDSDRGPDTGAGSLIRPSELSTGIGRQIRHVQGDAAGPSKIIDLEVLRQQQRRKQKQKQTQKRRSESDESEETDDDLSEADSGNDNDNDSDGELVDEAEDEPNRADDAIEMEMDTDREDNENPAPALLPSKASVSGEKRKGYWHTFKYRPILGIVPLSLSRHRPTQNILDGDNEEWKEGVEVALVERLPPWETSSTPTSAGGRSGGQGNGNGEEMPGRFYGAREWKAS